MKKRIKIAAYEAGLVYENGKLTKVLFEGKSWVRYSALVLKCDMRLPFQCTSELNILLKNEELKAALDVIYVGDNEIVLKYVNNQLQEILKTGVYAFWKNVDEYKLERINLSEIEIPDFLSQSILSHTLLAPYVRNFTVLNHEQGLLFVNNKFVSKLNSGNYFWFRNATTIHVGVADMRATQMEIAGQELLTKDKANLRINFNIRYKIVDIEKALLENKDYERQLYLIVQLALREALGALTLDELLNQKAILGAEIVNNAKNTMTNLGIELIEGGIKDIILPGDVKAIMNQVLVAEKKAQANSIMRREETASTRSLLNTAKLMEENEVLWKLKEMEYIEKIAEKVGQISISGKGNVLTELKEIFGR